VDKVVQEARRSGACIHASLTTAYCNTIPPRGRAFPWRRDIEHKVRPAIPLERGGNHPAR